MKQRNLFLAAAVAAAFGSAPHALARDNAAQSVTSGSSTAKAGMTDQSSGADAKSAAARGNKAQGNQSADAGAQNAAALVVLMPVAIASTDNLGNGCWARLYDGQNFSGATLSLVGPIEMPNMRTPFGTDWSGEFDSVAVGPKARVTVYDNENYSQRVANFDPGERIANLGGQMGLFEQVRSLKIACNDPARTADQNVGSADQRAAKDQNTASARLHPQPVIADPASPQGLRSFASLDKDNDGNISRAEWNEASGRTAAVN